jgi:uncharacterized protein (TIGR03437 family)
MRLTHFAAALIFTAALAAQNPTLVTLEVDVTNGIGYEQDVFEYVKYGTDPNPIPRQAPSRGFGSFIQIYDVVAVNSRPVKGNLVFRSTRLGLTPNAQPGQNPATAIADIERGTIGQWHMEILQVNGTAIGTFMAVGFPNGAPPPGAPTMASTHNMAIVGGTGAFLGARGYLGMAAQPFSVPNSGVFRVLSYQSDPANRRTLNGGTFGVVVQFASLLQPVVREVLHLDFTPVTVAKPARKGETLMMRASGLGPVRGAVLDKPFPVDPLAVVNSPLDVTVAGKVSLLSNQIGWPGQVDIYRIDFSVPDSVPSGQAVVRLTSAWVPAAEVQIPIE